VPYGYAGPGSDNGQGLIDNAGLYNFDLADTAARISGGQRSLLSAPTTTFADLAIRHRLSDWLDAFVEVAHTRRESEFMAGPSGTITLTAANPGNPFNQSIRIAVPFVGADGVTSSESEDTKIVLGAVFDLFASWRGAFDHTWDQSSSRGVSIAGSLDGGQVTAVRAGAIDAFRDVNAFATDFSPFLQPTTTFGPGETTFESTALRLSGPLPLRLPGGGVTMSILLEHRKDELGRYTISSATSEDVIFGRSQTVDAVYAEALLPIISPQNHIPGIHALDAQLAVRAERYDLRTSNRTSASIPAPETHVESEFDSTNPTLGLRWMPSADLMVRASYGEGFLPPALSLFVADAPFVFAAGDIPSFYGVTDPSRGGELIGQNNEVSVRGGGSLTLRPEHSETVSAGFVLTPRFVDGFRFSADWTRIDKTDNIASPLSYTAQADVDFLLQFAPERVTRSTDPSTLGAFTVGPIVGIDVSPINVATARSEAIDFNVEQRLETPWGQLSLQGRATHTLEVSSQLSPIAPEFDNAGRVDAPDWRANASLTLEHGGLTVSWTVNYVGDYFVNFDQSFNVQQGSDKVDEQTYQDLFVSYQFGEMGNALANVQLVAGVRNIFDEAPPIDMNSDFNTIGNYSPWGDARGASYYVSLRKAF
jgi:iron complex outermembrane receptor protein